MEGYTRSITCAISPCFRSSSARAKRRSTQIIKDPRLANKQGAFSVVNTAGKVLKRGQDLKQVLKVFDKVLKLVET